MNPAKPFSGFYSKFASFTLYFLISMVCFVLRPWPPMQDGTVGESVCNSSGDSPAPNSKPVVPQPDQPSFSPAAGGIDYGNDNYTLGNNITFLTLDLMEGTLAENSSFNGTDINDSEQFDYCYLMNYNTEGGLMRLVLELLTLGGAALYLLNAAKEIQFLGYQTFLENLMTVPSRIIFLFSCFLISTMIPMRFSCACRLEDKTAVCVMVLIAPYFLFFCRGFRMIGPIVVMIYKMILTDLLCFVIIYLVFVMGFSQAYYVIFLSYKGDPCNNFFRTPFESIMALFVMSLTQFQDIYEEFENTDHPYVAKAMFIMYMALVGILLINMLIAMMGKTYQDIASRKNEWLRQWARIVLVVERGVPPEECLKQLMKYSQPMADGRRALIVRQQHDEHEKEELRILDELKTTHNENRRRQQAGSNILSPPSTPQKTISSTSL